MPGPNDHQNLQPFPRLNSPLVDLEDGQIQAPWYRFLIGIWQRLGGSASSFPLSVFAQQEADSIQLFNSQTGELLGLVALEKIPQEIPFDLTGDPSTDIKQALALQIPAESLDRDQLVMASLAAAVPTSLVP